MLTIRSIPNPPVVYLIVAENIDGPMELSIAVSLPMAIVRERGLIHSLTVRRILVSGTAGAITELVNASGRMAESTRENGGMVRHMGTASKNEPTGQYGTKGLGIMMFLSENDDLRDARRSPRMCILSGSREVACI